MPHPAENDLALLAGGDASPAHRFFLERHVRHCEECQAKVAEYHALKAELFDADIPEMNWNFLAADMRANIRLGLEAGACVRETQVPQRWSWNAMPSFWNARVATALALLLLLVGTGITHDRWPLLNQARWTWHRPTAAATIEANTPVLETNPSGVELRKGVNSLTLLNRNGGTPNQTVSAQGDIGARSIDDTGSVTITNVYLQ